MNYFPSKRFSSVPIFQFDGLVTQHFLYLLKIKFPIVFIIIIFLIWPLKGNAKALELKNIISNGDLYTVFRQPLNKTSRCEPNLSQPIDKTIADNYLWYFVTLVMDEYPEPKKDNRYNSKINMSDVKTFHYQKFREAEHGIDNYLKPSANKIGRRGKEFLKNFVSKMHGEWQKLKKPKNKVSSSNSLNNLRSIALAITVTLRLNTYTLPHEDATY